MNKLKSSKRDLYYTNRHEWIDFQGSIAYIGACPIKLKNIPGVEELQIEDNAGFARQGEIIARIQCNGITVPMYMPVEGKIISINEVMLSGNHQMLLEQPQNNGWLALIAPSKPYDRSGLMQAEQYMAFVKQKR